MNIHPWKRAVALLAVATYLTTACTTLQNVPIRNADQTVARPAVNVGESVVVTTRSGEKKQFTVTAVDEDALVGVNERVAYADMQQLDVRRSEGGKKGLIIGAVVLGVAAIAAAAGGGGGGGGSGY
jgi:uncharacterized lipoprotein YajG